MIKTGVKFTELIREPEYQMIMIAAAMSFLISILIHFPYAKTGPPFYSDIVGAFWTRLEPNGLREVVYGIPYVNYVFEYPPICGLILWFGGWESAGNLGAFAAIEFGILLIFSVLTAHYLYLFLDHLGLSHNRQLIFTIFAPTLIFYGAYNFDIVQVFFVVLSLYWFIANSKPKASAFALGLAVATKLSPALLLPIFLQDISGNRNRATYTIITGGTFAAFNIPFMIANYNTWLAGYTFLKNYILEDSFLVWVFNSDTSLVAKDVSYVLLAGVVLCIYFFFWKRPLLVRAFMVTCAFLLFSYIAAPQLNLELLPFFALVPLIPIPLFYLSEFADVAIIISWFNITTGYASLPGITQTYALIRQICIAIMLGILAISGRNKAGNP